MTGLAWKRVASGQVGLGEGDCGDCWRPKRVWAMILGLGLSPVSSLNDVHVYALLCCVAGNARTPRHLKRRRQQRQPATKRNPTSHCGRRRWPGAAGWWSRVGSLLARETRPRCQLVMANSRESETIVYSE